MRTLSVRPAARLEGETRVPGDKSISHRALIIGSLAGGQSHVRNWLVAGDTLATLGAMQAVGIVVERTGDNLSFQGGKLRQPDGPIDCVNAGTAMRLLAGVLAGQRFSSILDGSEQLRCRPMRRIVEPLRQMGADIEDTDGHSPLYINPADLHGMRYELPVASAQVKSALLLAGLYASTPTTIIEPGPSRDHTERMLAAMGAPVVVGGRTITIDAAAGDLTPLDMTVPGDISSAAFLIAAAILVPGSDVRVVGVGINPTRTGLLDVLQRMGAVLHIEEEDGQQGEPVGMLHARGGALRAARIDGDDVVRAIDELPVLAVVATQAEGETVIAGAGELRVKEVDRISLLAQELRKLGAEVEEMPDGMIIGGPIRLHGNEVSSHGDHRLGMALVVAGLVADGETRVMGSDCIGDSFPGFAATLARLGAEISW